MDELNEFIEVLNAECDKLKKDGEFLEHVSEPWRYYSSGLIDIENEYMLCRAVIEAGFFTVEAEKYVANGEINEAWCSLAKAQSALLKSLSTRGKAIAKKKGHALGGQSKLIYKNIDDDPKFKIICIAEEIYESEKKKAKDKDKLKRGLAARVEREAALRGLDPVPNIKTIREIIKEFKVIS